MSQTSNQAIKSVGFANYFFTYCETSSTIPTQSSVSRCYLDVIVPT